MIVLRIFQSPDELCWRLSICATDVLEGSDDVAAENIIPTIDLALTALELEFDTQLASVMDNLFGAELAYLQNLEIIATPSFLKHSGASPSYDESPGETLHPPPAYPVTNAVLNLTAPAFTSDTYVSRDPGEPILRTTRAVHAPTSSMPTHAFANRSTRLADPGRSASSAVPSFEEPIRSTNPRVSVPTNYYPDSQLELGQLNSTAITSPHTSSVTWQSSPASRNTSARSLDLESADSEVALMVEKSESFISHLVNEDIEMHCDVPDGWSNPVHYQNPFQSDKPNLRSSYIVDDAFPSIIPFPNLANNSFHHLPQCEVTKPIWEQQMTFSPFVGEYYQSPQVPGSMALPNPSIFELIAGRSSSTSSTINPSSVPNDWRNSDITYMHPSRRLEKKPTRVGRHRGPAPYFFRPTLTFKKVGRRKKDTAGSLSLAQLVQLDATLTTKRPETTKRSYIFTEHDPKYCDRTPSPVPSCSADDSEPSSSRSVRFYSAPKLSSPPSFKQRLQNQRHSEAQGVFSSVFSAMSRFWS
ncbi:hypothetical protein C8J57DRAFT_1231611 [Mycena rebaudengoi]|nr:hypothetical protein C8J57DRAFT_1231611 [Mycena rebaudengoi]